MLKKTIKYKKFFTDDSAEEVEEDFYFNLTKFEVIEINLMEDLLSVGKSTNTRRIIPTFKRIVKASVGQKIDNEFVKNDTFTEAFVASEAYSNLFIEILGTGDAETKMAAFVKGIIPADMSSIKDFGDQEAIPVTDS